jgi:hypothetical protein
MVEAATRNTIPMPVSKKPTGRERKHQRRLCIAEIPSRARLLVRTVILTNYALQEITGPRLSSEEKLEITNGIELHDTQFH